MLISTDIRLRNDNKICRSVNGVRYTIKSKEHLQRLKLRYYVEHTGGKYKLLKGDEEELIGKTLFFRSPITCSSKDGVCKVCYGDLFYTNKDLYSAGALSGTKTTNPISQNVLSSKHLLTTISQFIEFLGEFLKFFSILGNEVYPSSNTDIDLNEYNIVFNRSDIKTVEEYDETDFNYYVNVFYVKNRKTGEIFEMKETEGKDIHISPELGELLKKASNKPGDTIEVPFSKIDDEMRLFAIVIKNNELTAPLYAIMHALDVGDHNGAETIDELAQMLLDLFIESNNPLDAVHGEMLIKPLIRDAYDVLKAPNFNVFKYNEKPKEGMTAKERKALHKDYQILTLSSALEKNPSVLIGLSFQSLGRQFTDPLTYRKEGTSFLDPFFKEKLL